MTERGTDTVAITEASAGGGRATKTVEPARPDRPDNLFDPGAHGPFDTKTHQAVNGFNPTWLRVGAALMLGAVASVTVLGRAR